MNLIHCLFQSFEGAGSIYISEAPTLEQEHLSSNASPIKNILAGPLLCYLTGRS